MTDNDVVIAALQCDYYHYAICCGSCRATVAKTPFLCGSFTV